MEIIYPKESYDIIGACFEVYNEMGFGFNEAVYQECLEFELDFQSIAFEAQRRLNLTYKGKCLKQKYIPDLICMEKIVVELKAVSSINDEHRGQVLNYIRATGMKLGLLVNFGHSKKLEWERIVL